MSGIRVLVVDDHQVVRQGLKALLESDPGIEVVGEAADGEQAIIEAKRSDPRVIIMDVAMPGMGGELAMRQIRKSVPESDILVLSAYSDAEIIREMVCAGAAGYLVKGSCGEELIKAVHEVAKGERSFSPCIIEGLRREKQRDYITGRIERKAAGLTGRQLEVLELVAEGLSNKEIASKLGVSVKTIEKHRQGVMDNLGIHETAGLTRYALGRGMAKR